MKHPRRPFYEEDGITIYHGDNREILPHLGPLHGLLLADPPYGISFAAQPTDYQRLNGAQRKHWDNERAPEWVISLARTLCVYQIIWGGNYYDLPPSRCWLSWHKPDAPPSMGNVEYAWTNLNQNSRQITRSIAATNAERVGHPTQKPLSVIQWAMGQVGGDVDSILDPWMGSGTTLVAAKLAGRPAIGIEREEEYCRMAVDRLRQGVLSFAGHGAAGSPPTATGNERS